MSKYSLWMEIPEETKLRLLRDYIEESQANVDEEQVLKNIPIIGIRKQVQYKNVENDEDVKHEQVPIGILGVARPDKTQNLIIQFHYIDPKFRGDFETLYAYLIEQFKKDGIKYLGWNADPKTSRFMQRKANNKAVTYYHYSRIDDYKLQDEQPKEEKKPVQNIQQLQKEEPSVQEQKEEEVKEKEISSAGTGQYPGDNLEEVRH